MKSAPFRKRLIIAVLALAGLSAVAGGVFFFKPSSTASAAPTPPRAAPVSVATVEEREVTLWDEFSGRLEAIERVDVRSRVAGAVQSVHFREGAMVKQNELLIRIDPAPYAAEVERAEAQVVAAQARVSHTTSEHERARRLWEDSAIAQRELDERVNAQREAQANLRGAQAALQSARLSLGYTQVRAPVAGRVGKLEVTVGNLVASGPGAPVLTTLVSISPIYASFEADEQIVLRALKDVAGSRADLARIPVHMGTAATSDTPYKGKLQLVDNQVDAKSGTVRVRALFDNKDGTLLPGQFARLRMGHAKTASALLISERAIGTDQNKKFVMVVDAEDKAQYREVTLGASVEGLRIVSSGLKAGERIVVNGLQRVRPGSPVAPQQVDMLAKSS
jgi:multidrug efflux system membrane fusion protein